MLNRSFSLLGPLALGAAAMYLLDPDRGTRRRALIRDKVVSASRRTRGGAVTLACDLQNRAVGAASEIRGLFERAPVDDAVIEARARAELGRVSAHPGAIATFVSNGCVALSGQILASEHHQVVRAIRRVRGVKDVIEDLNIHESAATVPALQGGSIRPAQTRGSWSPTTQLLVALAGAGAVAYARSRAH